jgi:hypothetical protein
MIPVQKWHFSVWFDPYLKEVSPIQPIQYIKMYFVLCILRDVVQSSDVQLEFATFAEFAKTCAKTDKIRSSHRDS